MLLRRRIWWYLFVYDFRDSRKVVWCGSALRVPAAPNDSYWTAYVNVNVQYFTEKGPVAVRSADDSAALPLVLTEGLLCLQPFELAFPQGSLDWSQPDQ
eukprot:2909922-Rhodomonas_salina.1